MIEPTTSRGLAAWTALAPLATALLAAAGLSACGDADKGQPKPPPVAATALPNCPPAVPANINQISISGKSASIKLQDPRHLPTAGAGLRWKLNTNGYTFTGNGIGIASPPAGAASSSSGTEFQWCFGATTQQTQWKYSISFYADSAPSVVYTCDPTIISSDSLVTSTADSILTCTAP